MINVKLKNQISNVNGKVGDILYCTENNTFYRLSSTNESITLNNTDFIVSNGANYWIAFGGQNSKVPQKVLNDDLDDSQNVISEIDSSFQLNDGILGLKNFNNDNVQYANKNGAWTEIVSSGGSSEVAPVITTTNLMLDATTHSHIFNNNTTDLIHILPLASENTGKRFLLKNKNTGLTYLKSGQVSVNGSATINGIYSENGVVNGRMSYVCNYVPLININAYFNPDTYGGTFLENEVFYENGTYNGKVQYRAVSSAQKTIKWETTSWVVYWSVYAQASNTTDCATIDLVVYANWNAGYINSNSTMTKVIVNGLSQLIKYSGTAWQIFSNTDNTTAVITATNGTEIYPYSATWNGITVTQVTDTMDGLTTIVLPVKGSYIEVESDGVTWNVIRESY